MIVGAQEFIAGEAETISGIEVVDDRTVRFTLTRPEWTLLNRFALAPGSIIAREGVEAAENFGRAPLGAGPFVLDSWESGIRLTFSRNENYYEAGLPVLDGVIIDIGVEPAVGILRIQNGEADVSLDFVPNSEYAVVSTDPALADNLLEINAFPNTQYIIPNVRSAPFDNPQVRMALNMAIDRERLSLIYNNRAVPAAGPVPPGVEGDNAELLAPTFDLEAARALLAEAGYPDGLTTQIYTTTDPVDVSIIQSVIQDWAQIGVNAELISVEFAQWLDIAFNRPEDMPLAYIGWFMDYQDPSNVYEPLIACGGSFNPGGYCNEEMDAVFTEAKVIPPGPERWDAYSALEALVAENVPALYLVHTINYYYLSDRVTSLEPDAATLINFATVTLE
jgi:ABC-type transport system substrate-binding protein